MKRYTRKTLAIFMGLAMGWYVAGMTSTFASESSQGHENAAEYVGDNEHAAENEHATTDEHAAKDEHATGNEVEAGHGEVDGHGSSADADAAKKLVPHNPHDIAWYPKVIYTIIGLFITAILVGLVGKSRNIREPGVLASEEDAEQAHGADEEDPHH